MSFDLIIFDCDGTLVDSEYAHDFAIAEILRAQGFDDYNVERVRDRFTGNRFSQILEILSAETGHIFPGDIRQTYISRARALLPTHQKSVPGAADLVEYAKARGKICVASNGQRDNVFYSLEVAGLLPLFDQDYIFTGLDVENAKPAPDLFLMAAEKLGAEAGKTLVIEDSLVGARAGLAAGMTTFGFVGTSHSPDAQRAALLDLGVERVFDRLIHIQDHLAG
jgi:HAD superfamily hydrolase (TIGR01509 family)